MNNEIRSDRAELLIVGIDGIFFEFGGFWSD
jgi:hypothetical protein